MRTGYRFWREDLFLRKVLFQIEKLHLTFASSSLVAAYSSRSKVYCYRSTYEGYTRLEAATSVCSTIKCKSIEKTRKLINVNPRSDANAPKHLISSISREHFYFKYSLSCCHISISLTSSHKRKTLKPDAESKARLRPVSGSSPAVAVGRNCSLVWYQLNCFHFLAQWIKATKNVSKPDLRIQQISRFRPFENSHPRKGCQSSNFCNNFSHTSQTEWHPLTKFLIYIQK